MNPQSRPKTSASKSKHPILRLVLLLVLVLVVGLLAWSRWVYVQIERYASHDQASPADAIAVFGQQSTTASLLRSFVPVSTMLKRSITRESRHSSSPSAAMEATSSQKAPWAAKYRVGAGVPESDIIAETESTSTEQSAHRLAVIARTNSLHRLVVVSDATHLFRIHEICAANGLDVLTSPRPRVPTEGNPIKTSASFTK